MKIQRYGDKILGLWWPHIGLTYENIAWKLSKVIYSVAPVQIDKNQVFFVTEFSPFLQVWMRRFNNTSLLKIQQYGDKILGLWWSNVSLTYETIAR